MNLEASFQMLEKATEYADYEFIFAIFGVNIYCLLQKARPKGS